MTKHLMIATIAVAALCCGCSTKQTVGIMSDEWEVGQHQDCIFKADQLYCIPAGMDAMGVRLQAKTKDGKPVPRSAMLSSNSVEIIHLFERKRSEGRNDRNADTGLNVARFSERPTKYSIWDCHKTGSGSPAISCALSLKPSEKAMPFFTRKEEEAQMDDMLKAMNMDGLQAKCGKPASETSDGISRWLVYTADSGTPIAFRFASYGNAFLLDSAQSQEKKAPNDPFTIFWWKSAPGRGLSEAGRLVKEMPCLKAERNQELVAGAARE